MKLVDKLKNTDREQRAAFLFFAVSLIFGLLMVKGYGPYWDYEDEMLILWQNIHQYAESIFGADSFVASKFAKYTVISLSDEKDHGIALYYVIAPLLFKAFGYSKYVIWKAYVFLVFFAGSLGIYASARILYGSRRLSLFLSALYLYAPLPFAYGHFDNKDIGFLTLSVLTLTGVLKWTRTGKKRWGIFFGAAAAFAANCKILGLLFFGMGLIYVWICGFREIDDRNGAECRFKSPNGKEQNAPAPDPNENGSKSVRRARTKLAFCQLLLAGFSFCIVFFLITPAAWPDPAGYLVFVIRSVFKFVRWGGSVKFGGVIYPEGTTPWYYLGGMIVLTTPVLILILILLGHAGIITDRKRRLDLLYLALLWVIPFCYGSFGDDIIYDEWRHFFFLWGYLILIAGEGALLLKGWGTALGSTKSPHGRLIRSWHLIAAAVLVCYLLLMIVTGHPYEMTYTNLLAGSDASENYQVDYWQVSFDAVIRRLITCADRNQELELTIGGADPYYNNNAVDYTYRSMDPQVQQYVYPGGTQANYLLEAKTYEGIAQNVDLTQYHTLFTLEAFDKEIVTVWEKN